MTTSDSHKHSNEKSNREYESRNKYDYSGLFKSVFHKAQTLSWLQLFLNFLPTIIGIFMGPKGVIWGVAATAIIFILFFAVLATKEVDVLNKVEPSSTEGSKTNTSATSTGQSGGVTGNIFGNVIITPPSASGTDPAGRPAFSEQSRTVTVRMGVRGMSVTLKNADGVKPLLDISPEGLTAFPQEITAHTIVTAKVTKGILTVDASLYSDQMGGRPVLLRNNETIDRPEKWDRNFVDNRALEIVDQNGNPIFQLVYKNSTTAILRGIFSDGTTVAVVDDQRLAVVPPGAAITSVMQPLFKYPSFKYMGIFTDDPKKQETSDLQSIKTEETAPTPMNSQSGQNNVNAPYNQGNINVGPVSGNLSQTVENIQIGSKQRKLSPEIRSALTQVFLKFEGTQDLEINGTFGDSESVNFAKEISDCRPPKDNLGVGQSMWTGNLKGLTVTVKDLNSIPPLATALMRAFGSDLLPTQDSKIADTDRVEIRVFPQPNP